MFEKPILQTCKPFFDMMFSHYSQVGHPGFLESYYFTINMYPKCCKWVKNDILVQQFNLQELLQIYQWVISKMGT